MSFKNTDPKTSVETIQQEESISNGSKTTKWFILFLYHAHILITTISCIACLTYHGTAVLF